MKRNIQKYVSINVDIQHLKDFLISIIVILLIYALELFAIGVSLCYIAGTYV